MCVCVFNEREKASGSENGKGMRSEERRRDRLNSVRNVQACGWLFNVGDPFLSFLSIQAPVFFKH